MSGGGAMGGMGGGGGGGVPWANIGATIGDIADYHIGRRQNANASAIELQQQKRANALYTDLYGQTQGEYNPYQQAGSAALQALMSTYGLQPSFDSSNEYRAAEQAYNANPQQQKLSIQSIRQGEATGSATPQEKLPFNQSSQYASAKAAYEAAHSATPDYSGFYNSPDYQFNFNQGLTALDHSAAAHGSLYSGQQMKAAQQFGQGLASNYLNTYRQGLGNLSTQGLQATNALSNYRAGYGNTLGTGLTNIGDIKAAEYLGYDRLHRDFNSSQKSVWGVSGGGGSPGGGQSSYVQGMNFGTGYGQNSGPGSGYYTGPGSSSYNFGGTGAGTNYGYGVGTGDNWLSQGFGGG